MFAADVFDSRIINDEEKSDGKCFLLPEARLMLDSLVSKRCQMLNKFSVY